MAKSSYALISLIQLHHKSRKGKKTNKQAFMCVNICACLFLGFLGLLITSGKSLSGWGCRVGGLTKSNFFIHEGGSLSSQNEKFGLRGFFISPIFFIHEDGSLFSQNEKFGLRGFFTSPIFFIHEDGSYFSQKKKFGLRGFFTSPNFSSMRGKGGGGERKKGGEFGCSCGDQV